jgi:hypothetical protein
LIGARATFHDKFPLVNPRFQSSSGPEKSTAHGLAGS